VLGGCYALASSERKMATAVTLHGLAKAPAIEQTASAPRNRFAKPAFELSIFAECKRLPSSRRQSKRRGSTLWVDTVEKIKNQRALKFRLLKRAANNIVDGLRAQNQLAKKSRLPR